MFEHVNLHIFHLGALDSKKSRRQTIPSSTTTDWKVLNLGSLSTSRRLPESPSHLLYTDISAETTSGKMSASDAAHPSPPDPSSPKPVPSVLKPDLVLPNIYLTE